MLQAVFRNPALDSRAASRFVASVAQRKRSSSLLAQKVYEYLLEKLLHQELLPGQIVNRRSIAEELKVSIAPVLEAMVRLESEGLVTTIPRKGTQVRLVRPEETADHLVLREAIECEAARFYCGAPVEKHKAELKRLGKTLDDFEGSPVEEWKCEIAFHRRLVELSECKSLLAAFQQSMHLGTLCAVNFVPEPNKGSASSHEKLVDRLTTRDPDEAEKFMRAHLRCGKRVVFKGPAQDQELLTHAG